MFTYIKEDNVICTCDFLGAHYTFSDVFAQESKELEHSAKRYYAEIMMPFRMMCKKYTQMVKDMNVDMICRAERAVLKLIGRKQRKTRGRSAPGLLLNCD